MENVNVSSNMASTPLEPSRDDAMMALLQGIKNDMQSMSDRLSKVEKEQSSPASAGRPSTNRMAAQSASPVGLSNHLSWAERMEEHDRMIEDTPEEDHAAKNMADVEEDYEVDAKGAKLFQVSDQTFGFLKQSFTGTLANTTRRQTREKFGLPNTPFTATPSLDKVLRSRVTQATKSRDKELARLQSLALDAVGPLSFIVEEALKGRLLAADNLEAAQSALRLLGNFSNQCNRLRRTNVLTNLNTSLVDMAEEDEIFKDAGQELFGAGFCKKAKERDDELKALNRFSSRHHPRHKPAEKTFFHRQDRRDRRDQRPSQSFRGKARFAPYSGTPNNHKSSSSK